MHTLFQVERRDGAAGPQPWRLHQPEGSHVGVDVRELPVAGLEPQLATVQAAGSSYSLHHSTIHKTAMPVEDACSVFCRGPAMKPCALQLQPDVRTYRWKFGQADETPKVVADRKMSDRSSSATSRRSRRPPSSGRVSRPG